MLASCPDITELELLAGGKLRGMESDEIGSHVDSCSSCRDLFAEVKENLQFAGAMRQVMRKIDLTHAAPALPEYVGEYRIIREIGRGGMGIVFEAEQPEPQRRVAIKVIHAGLGFDGRIERMFRREAAALARLTHPSIAAIYEAGRTGDGCSFFAMELVDGVSLSEFARREALSITAKLKLFSQVCEALAFAHQRGVIHRDLKPSNILVNPNGLPKILDFGLAKILELDDQTLNSALTEEGRIQGTLPYMSPEQVRGNLIELDVRSDVYSLGVVLHELLSGSLPYPIDRKRLAEAAQTICEKQPTRLSAVSRHLRGDLETIVLKALEKDADRRYSSASALAEDILRFLGDQPILARPPTVTYQVRKLIARHKAPSALLATILLLIIGFGVAMSVLYARSQANLVRARAAESKAVREAERAKHEAEVANQIKDFLTKMFNVSDPDIAQGKSITARELLDWAAQRAETELNHDLAIQATIMQVIGRVYNNLGMYDGAAKLLGEALAKRQQVDANSKDVSESAYELASVQRSRGDLDGAQRNYQLALDIIKRTRSGDEMHLLPLMQKLVDVRQARGDLNGAESAARELIDTLRRSQHGAFGLVGALNTLAGILAEKEEYAAAIPLMREAIQATTRPGWDGKTTRMRLEGNLAWLLAQNGEYAEAEPMIRRTLQERRKIFPPGHPDIATSLVTLGVIHLRRGEAAQAEPLFREAMEIRERSLTEDKAAIAEAKGFLGKSLSLSGRYEEAEKLLLDSHALMTPGHEGPPASARSRVEGANRLAQLYTMMGREAEAERWTQTAETIGRSAMPHTTTSGH